MALGVALTCLNISITYEGWNNIITEMTTITSVMAGLTPLTRSLFLIHSSSFSDSLVFLMTSLTQKSIGHGYNECIVQDNLHVKPDLPATACQGTHNPIVAHSAEICCASFSI